MFKNKEAFRSLHRFALVSIISVSFFGCGGPKLVAPGRRVDRSYSIRKDQADQLATDSQRLQADTGDVFLDRSTGKVYYVGLLVPLTGRFAGIGQQVLEAVLLAVYSSDYGQIRVVPFDTKSSDSGAKLAAQKAVDMDVDVVLGPVFASETRAVKNILQIAGIKTFSLSNDATVASEDIYVFGIPPEALMTTVLTFAKQEGLHNYGLILPSSEYGYSMSKSINALLTRLQMFSMATEYYPRNRDMFGAVANRILFSQKRSYRVSEDGSLVSNNIRDRAKRTETQDALPLVEKSMNALYVDAKGADLDAMISELDRVGARRHGLQIFASDFTTNWSDRLGYRMEGIMLPSVASSAITSAEHKFLVQTGRKPTRISLLAYDAISTIIYALKKDKIIGKQLYLHSGYNGILGDFRFLKSGLVQRRFGIYVVKAGHLELLYTSPLFI